MKKFIFLLICQICFFVFAHGNKCFFEQSSLTMQNRTKIIEYIRQKKYTNAIALLSKMDIKRTMNEQDLFYMIYCQIAKKNYSKSKIYCVRWLNKYQNLNLSNEADVHYYLGISNSELKNYIEADRNFAQAISSFPRKSIEMTSKNDCMILYNYYDEKGCNYVKACKYKYALEAFDIAVQYRIRGLGFTTDDLTNGKIKDWTVGKILNSISVLCAVFLNDEERAEQYTLLSAMCDFPDALDTCEHMPKLKEMLKMAKNR